MRVEVLDVLKKDGRVLNKLEFGQFEGKDFVLVDSWETIDLMDDILEDSGIDHDDAENELGEYGFDDEYTMCGCCYNYLKTTPNYYGELPDFVTIENEYFCLECAKDHKKQYIEERINDANNAIRFNLINEDDLNKLGFARYNVDSFESGYHAGMNDEPKEIFEKLSKHYNQIIFIIDESSQFYTKFSDWVRND